MNKTCLTCYKDFIARPSGVNKFCSRLCFNLSEEIKKGGFMSKGKVSPMKGKKHNEATLEKMRLSSRKGKTLSSEHRKRIGLANSIANKGKRIGHLVSYETREKIRVSLSGRKRPEITGEKHFAWKGGRENNRFLQKKRRAYKKGAEGSHTFEEWENVKKMYQFMCLCCKKQEPFVKLTQDHIIPLVAGGSNYIQNIQPLCLSCNSRKNSKTIDYRLDYVYA